MAIEFFGFFMVLALSLSGQALATTQPDALALRREILQNALAQSAHPSPQWNLEQRDCAGFIRFVFSRAMHSPDPLWLDRGGQRQYFADAETLISQNFTALPNSRSSSLPEESLQTGDVLVYYFPEKPKPDRWHLMLLLKSSHSSNRDILVIYHNGDKGSNGEIRKVWLSDLQSAPLSEWRPNSENAHFKGVYRWKVF